MLQRANQTLLNQKQTAALGNLSETNFYSGADMTSTISKFLTDEDGGILDMVLVVGVISVPLVIFLSLFGSGVVDWVQANAPNIFDEASSWVGG